MVAFLEGQIDYLAKQIEAFPRTAESQQWRERLDEALSLALDYFRRLTVEVESARPPGDGSPVWLLPFVPRYASWLLMGEKTLAFVKEAKEHGSDSPQIPDFVHALHDARVVVNGLERSIALHDRLERGEAIGGRTLQERLDELSGPDRTGD